MVRVTRNLHVVAVSNKRVFVPTLNIVQGRYAYNNFFKTALCPGCTGKGAECIFILLSLLVCVTALCKIKHAVQKKQNKWGVTGELWCALVLTMCDC